MSIFSEKEGFLNPQQFSQTKLIWSPLSSIILCNFCVARFGFGFMLYLGHDCNYSFPLNKPNKSQLLWMVSYDIFVSPCIWKLVSRTIKCIWRLCCAHIKRDLKSGQHTRGRNYLESQMTNFICRCFIYQFTKIFGSYLSK